MECSRQAGCDCSKVPAPCMQRVSASHVCRGWWLRILSITTEEVEDGLARLRMGVLEAG